MPTTLKKFLKPSLISLALLFTTIMINAQINNQYRSFQYFSQYYYQLSLYNPAFVANEEQPNIWASHEFRKDYRRTGTIVDTFSVQNYNAILQGQFQSFIGGAGLTFSYQRPTHQAKERQFVVSGVFAAGFDFTEDVTGIVGLNVGLLHYSNIRKTTGSGGSTVNDPFFKINLDAGLTLMYKELILGFSILHNSEPNFLFDGLPENDEEQNIWAFVNDRNTFKRTSYLNALYKFSIGNDFLIIPSFMFRNTYGVNFNSFSNNRVDIELSSLFEYKQIGTLGFSYKPTNDYYFASIMAAVKINKQYQLSFSYDFVKKDYKKRYANMELGIGIFLNKNNIDLDLIGN